MAFQELPFLNIMQHWLARGQKDKAPVSTEQWENPGVRLGICAPIGNDRLAQSILQYSQAAVWHF
jgi:hypothetical protein